MTKLPPPNIIMHYPTSPEGQAELADRVAQVHADAVIRQIKRLNCPYDQKIQLLDAVIADAKARIATTTPPRPQKNMER